MSDALITEEDQELEDPQSDITRYIWRQDHKVIAIQYSSTASSVGL